ncbi:MAG: DUF4143 domain-containing protein [bacterium]
MEGGALEGLVAQHLRAWSAYQGNRNKLYYWRTYHKVEVDFIVYDTDGFWAIEVKNTKKVRPQDLHSLTTFQKDYPECQTILLYRGKERFIRNKIVCLPCDEFLQDLHPRRLIA